MKVRKLLAMLLVLTMVLSITLPTAVLAVEGDDAGATVTQTTESTQPDEGGDTATVPDEGDDTATVPDEGGDTATVPDEGGDTATVPDEGGDTTTVPDEGTDPTPAPSESADPTPAPSESADPTPAPSESADPTPVPSESTDPTPVPSESADPTPVPSESADPTPVPSESTDPTPKPSESTVPAPTETVEIPEATVPGAALCEHGNDPTTCPKCAAMAVAKTVYEKIMAATTLAEYAAAKAELVPLDSYSIDALLAEYVATLSPDEQEAYADKIAKLEALVPPVLSFETVEEIYSAILAAETKADYDAILGAISDEQKAELDEYVLALPEEDRAAYAEKVAALTAPLTDVEAIYNALMAAETLEEFDAVLEPYSDEERTNFLMSLDDEQLEQMQKHSQTLYEASVTFESKIFTDAGPLMPPVEVEVADIGRAMLMNGPMLMSLPTLYSADPQQEEDSLYQSKEVDWDSENGTGTITIETYATGKYTITEDEKTVPADIVLVLDQSGSMAYNFNGNSTNDNTARRQYAMKVAVNNFIDSVAEQYSSEADHRIAIVTFGTNSTTLQGWTYVDETGNTNLKQRINSLPDEPEGATNVASGMERAENLITGNGYTYGGDNTTRSKVVIVFTDGVPTKQSDFDTSVATAAIETAYDLKNAGVSVYSIGIFNGVNNEELHGDKWDYLIYSDISCSGEVGSYWGGSYAAGIFGSNDFAEVDIPAGNRFLNYLSSNFDSATEIGASKGTYNPGNHLAGSGTGYKITENFERSSDQYYLTATDSDSLNQIFQKIKDQIGSGSTTVTLNEESIIRDVISDYFVLDMDTSAGKEVEAYTVPCTGVSGGVYQFDEGKKTYLGSSDVSVSSDSGTIDVSGFDFSSRYVAETGRPAPGQETGDTYHGDKLVIKIHIKTKDGFWGGNGVPTNKDASGIYVDAEHEEPEVAFDIPTADVQIHQPENTNKTTNIYYGGEAPTAGDVYTPVAGPAEDWQDDYVSVTYSELTPGTISNTLDGTYSVTVTVSPTRDGTLTATTATCTGTVNVYTPVIAFADRYAYVTQAETSYSGNLPQADVTWEHSGTAADAQTEFYNNATEPQLTYTATAMVGTDSANDFHVKVSEVKNGNTVIPTGSYRTTHKSCDLEDDCNFNAGSGDFMVHIFKPTITWKDGKQNYNTELTQGLLESHKVSVVWKHSSGVENTAFVTKGLLPDASTLTLTYGFQTTSGAELVDTHLTAETDVQVTLDINGTPATTYTTFNWSPEGLCDCASGPVNAQFRIHLNNFDLVVRKTVNNPYDSQDTFLFTLYQDGNEYATFTLTNGGEATFKNLEAGHSYSVEEDTGWSWRYTPQGGASKTVDTTTLVNNTATVAFTNTRTNNNWLSQDASAENDFGSTGVAVTRSVAALPPERAKLAVPDEKGEEAE